MLQPSDIKSIISAQDITWLLSFNASDTCLSDGKEFSTNDLKKLLRLKRNHDLVFVRVEYDFGMIVNVYSTPSGCGIPEKILSFSPEQQLPLRSVRNLQRHVEKRVKKIFTETKRNLALLEFCGIPRLSKYWYWAAEAA
jgi:hypothetical protein